MKLINSYLFLLFIFLVLYEIPFTYSEASILEFEAYHYRAGHFAVSSKGDLVVEYSRDNHRLFLGLRKMEIYFLKMRTMI